MAIECTVRDFFINCPFSGYSGLITAVENGEPIYLGNQPGWKKRENLLMETPGETPTAP